MDDNTMNSSLLRFLLKFLFTGSLDRNENIDTTALDFFSLRDGVGSPVDSAGDGQVASRLGLKSKSREKNNVY
jgi:hypothetical protein